MKRVITCVLLLTALPVLAHSEGFVSVDAGMASDAGIEDVPLVYPGDGGPALWAPILKGQRAPADGVFGTTERAAVTAGRIAGDEQGMKDASARPIPGYVWLAACAVAMFAGSAAGIIYVHQH